MGGVSWRAGNSGQRVKRAAIVRGSPSEEGGVGWYEKRGGKPQIEGVRTHPNGGGYDARQDRRRWTVPFIIFRRNRWGAGRLCMSSILRRRAGPRYGACPADTGDSDAPWPAAALAQGPWEWGDGERWSARVHGKDGGPASG